MNRFLITLALTTISSSAWATNPKPFHWVELSAGGAGLVTLGEEREPHLGGGVSITVTLIPHWLETELVVHALATRNGSAYPVDLVLRLPLYITQVIQPYLAAGATAVPFLHEEHEHVASGLEWGIATAAGIDFWVKRDVGVFTELNFNLLARENLTPELGLVTGAMVGF